MLTKLPFALSSLSLFLVLVGYHTLSWMAAPSSVQTEQAQGCWVSYESPVPIGWRDGLMGVSGLSSSDVWAVGSYYSSGNLLTMRFDGSRWCVVDAPPDPGFEVGMSTYLEGVDMVAQNDVWAVGRIGSSRPFDVFYPVTMHWDGAQWSHEPISTTEWYPPSLYSISAVAANDVWAVGDSGRGRNGDVSAFFRWDGSLWQRAPVSTRTALSGYVSAVEALAADDAWAVGNNIAHWDGKTWSVVVANVGLLSGLAAISPNDIWAVGRDGSQPLTMHWDGKTWTKVPNQILPAHTNMLTSVAAIATDDVWAIGTNRVYHWDGVAWRELSGPVNPATTRLREITAVGNDIWIVGHEIAGLNDPRPLRSYILRHTRGPCQSTSTPSPSPGTTFTRPALRQPVPPVPVPGSPGHTFTETGRTVPGLFLDYWIEHKGLSRYGLPISEPIGEVSEVDGKTYTVQYFERAVFEYHPENPPPHNVLLSLIGVHDYHRVYGPNGAPNQRVGFNAIYFPETGHWLGGIFHTIWRREGGLAEFGYPISEEFEELSPLDGNVYTVQYFERAVFEWHREHESPHAVEFSHLGRWRYESLYGELPPRPRISTPQLAP
ncbi:MAG: hypothetical protein M3441_01190 [Chloroflexota bacterium]|nr:hypothetical protein [Chloroflexota bacterium]